MSTDDSLEDPAAVARRIPTTMISRSEIREILRQLGVLTTSLAVLGERVTSLSSEKSRVDDLEVRVRALENFRSQVLVWGIVGGGIWSLALAILSLRLWQ